MDSENKNIEYLKAIQPIIARMNVSSNAVKGISITLSIFIFGMCIKECNTIYNILLYLILLICLFLDMYYLWIEKLYRVLYEDVRIHGFTSFNLSVDSYKKGYPYHRCITSIAIYPFYFMMLTLNTILIYYITFLIIN